MIIQKTNNVLYIPISVNSADFPQDYKKALNFHRKNHCHGVTNNETKSKKERKKEILNTNVIVILTTKKMKEK